MREVAEIIRKVTGSAIPTEIGPRRAGDPPVLVADSGKARKLLGWKPQYELQGIGETAYKWMRAHSKGYDAQ